MNKYNLEYISVEDAPNPADECISKRQWERLIDEWRNATRERCEAALPAVTGAAATIGDAASSSAAIASGATAADDRTTMSERVRG